MNRAEARKFLEAVVTRGQGSPAATQASLGEQQSLLLVSAAAGVAAELKFEDDGDVRLITGFAKDVERRYQAEVSDLKSSVVEAIVRTALGEEDLLDDVPVDEIVATGMIIVYEIISERFIGPIALEGYYRDVIDLASAFETEA